MLRLWRFLSGLTHPYIKGKNAENKRLQYAIKFLNAILGSRLRGSKVSKTWIRNLGFNPKIDLWFVDSDGTIHFEQLKSSGRNKPKATISKKEIAQVRKFANLFRNYRSVWIGYVLKQAYKKPVEVKLN